MKARSQLGRMPEYRLTPVSAPNRVVMRVRLSAYLNGDFGRTIEEHTRKALGEVPGLRLERLPIGLVVEARESPGVLMEHVLRAAAVVEAEMAKAYPVFLHEMGPIWAGTFCVVLAPEVA